MKKRTIVVLLFIITFNFLYCGLITSPDGDINRMPERDISRTIDDVIKYHPQDLVAVKAVFDKPEGRPEGYGSVILMDFYNTKSYKILTDTTMLGGWPRFSRDKRKLLFGDAYHGATNYGPQFVLYDLRKNTFEPLFNNNNIPDWELQGEGPVWNYDDTGFYFTKDAGSVQRVSDVRFYRFSDKYFTVISDSRLGSWIYPIGLKGQDTLIVFSNTKYYTGMPYGFYFMDLQGNHLSMLTNPYLELINVNGINKKCAYGLKWNDKLKLFVCAYHDSTFYGFKISVTDLYGNYFKSYTSGEYIDELPVWGPDGRYILFQRTLSRNTEPRPQRIMIIDVTTGAVREFLTIKDIPGAGGFMDPDF